MIKGVYFNNIGEAGQLPQFIYIDTNNTVAEVTATGFLNKLVAGKIPISEKLMAVVTTQTSPSATISSVNLFNITFASGNWSLTANSTPLALANGQIYVGNAGGVATGVTMSGDATISNTGALTISSGAITRAKIQNFNITLDKLSVGIAPAAIISAFGAFSSAGGVTTEAFGVAGADPSQDEAFVQFTVNASNRTILKSVVTTNTVTLTYSGTTTLSDTIAYQLVRLAQNF